MDCLIKAFTQLDVVSVLPRTETFSALNYKFMVIKQTIATQLINTITLSLCFYGLFHIA